MGTVEVHIGSQFGLAYYDYVECVLADGTFFRIVENSEELSGITSKLHSESSVSDLKIWERRYAISCCAALIVDSARIIESVSSTQLPSTLSIDTERYDSIAGFGDSIVWWAATLLARYKERLNKKNDPSTYYSNLSKAANEVIDIACLIAIKLGETDLAPYILERIREHDK